jgi:hypothetical protein
MEPHITRLLRRTPALLVALILMASCAGTSNERGTDDTNLSTPTTTLLANPAQVDLSGTCPDTVVIQTDWYPQAEHGGIYELLGTDYEVDTQTGATRGSLVSRGMNTGVDLEIRAGGPFLESPVVTEMFLDPDITFGYVGTDVAISRFAETPTLAVFNALTLNPQVILWNADKHPNVSSIADIAREVPAISVFGDRPFMRYFVARGLVPQDKVDSNYKGSLLLATDDVAHQGFVTSEPFRYSTLDSGAVATGFQLIHDAGWTSYPQNLAINKLRLDALRPCLTALVPLMQQAQIDFIVDPQRTIDTLLDVVQQLDTSWTQTFELANYAVDTMRSLGIVGNGSTDAFGDFESPRLDEFVSRAIPILREQGLNIPNLSGADLTTNEFIDATISMP